MIILLASIGVGLLSLAFLWAYFSFIKGLQNRIVKNKLFITIIIRITIYVFFVHYFYSAVVVINNFLSFIYLKDSNNQIFGTTANLYINVVKATPHFYAYLQISIAFLTIGFVVLFLLNLKKKQYSK